MYGISQIIHHYKYVCDVVMICMHGTVSIILHVTVHASWIQMTCNINTKCYIMQRSARNSVQVYRLQTRDAVDVKKDLKHQIAANVKMATIEILMITLASVSD